MKILAFAASNNRQSINRVLVEHAAVHAQSINSIFDEVEFLDLNDFEMPIYSPDREKENGIPDQAQTFFTKIGQADAIIVSFAEYNGSVTAAWKNIFDWMSRIKMKLWQGKPMVILAASPGQRAGQNVLMYNEMLAPHFGADLKGKAGFGSWSQIWDANNKTFTNQEDQQKLLDALAGLGPIDNEKR